VTVRPQSPGERLALELEARHWLQKDLAEIINRPMQMVSEIISGRKEITRETAAQLGAALGTPPEFWLGMQDTYQLWELSRHGPTQRKLKVCLGRAWPARKTDSVLSLFSLPHGQQNDRSVRPAECIVIHIPA
jgi:addiction module HigA family antidote